MRNVLAIERPGMVEMVGEPATLEQLAEECTELAKAALKLARIERGENPTPVTAREAAANIIEEFTDVYQVAHTELGINPDYGQIYRKQERLYKRMGM